MHLLHDTGLPLGEGNVATRLVLDEFDLNLSALATGLIIIIVLVLGAHAIPSRDVGVGGAVTGSGLLEVLVGGRGFLVCEGRHVGHDERKAEREIRAK